MLMCSALRAERCPRVVYTVTLGAAGFSTALQAGRSRVRFPFGRATALGLTQPLTEMSTTNISWGSKGGRCVGLTTVPPSCVECLEIWESQTPGTLMACPGLFRDCFSFTFICRNELHWSTQRLIYKI